MKKFMDFVVVVKAFAAMLFAGLMILYMVSGVLYTHISGGAFEYSIPFIFVLQGLGLSMAISVLWGVFISDVLIKKWRFVKRFIVFKASLMPLVAICFFTFLAIPTEWTIPWLISVLAVSGFVVILAILSEIYFKKTGENYTEALKQYKKHISQ